MKKIWLDTDIGSDIDDCFALSYLLRQKEAEIAAITTCTGDAHLRASLAHEICRTEGKEPPIYVGYNIPLTPDPKPHQRHLTALQQAVAEKSKPFSPQENYMEAIRRLIEEHPHQITLAAIGPMSNPAALFKKYPHLPALLEGAVLMCGRYGPCDDARWGATEWNVVCDPEAAATVFAQEIPNCLVLGVEQTCRIFKDPKKTKEAFASIPPVRDSVYPTADAVWFHDALAVAVLFERMGRWEQGTVTIQGTATPFTPDPHGRHSLLRDFCPAEFFAHYQRVTGLKLPQK